MQAMPIQCAAAWPVDATFIRCSKNFSGQVDQLLAETKKNIFAIRRSKNFHSVKDSGRRGCPIRPLLRSPYRLPDDDHLRLRLNSSNNRLRCNSSKPQRPNHVHQRMRGGGTWNAAAVTPGSSVEDSGNAPQQHVAPVER